MKMILKYLAMCCRWIERKKELVLAILVLTAVLVPVGQERLVNGDWGKVFQGDMLIAVVGAIAALYIGALQVRLQEDIMFKDLFKSFNDRYDTNINDLINKLRMEELTPKQDRGLEEQEKLLLLDYFNLCAEEYLWYKKGRIYTDVWKAWRSGIIQNLRVKSIRKLYDNEVSDKIIRYSYYGLVEELERDLKD